MHIPFTSQVLGVIEYILEALVSILSWFAEIIVQLFYSLFAHVLYGIGSQLLKMVDFVQSLFRRLAGLDTYWYDGVKQEASPSKTIDPILRFVTEDSVLDVLLALSIVAVAMLIIATIVQIIRVQYTQEGSKNTIGNVIGQTLKALAMFLIVPIACVLGIYTSNQILAAIDKATSPGQANTIGGAIFVASAGQANRVRLSETGTEQSWGNAFSLPRKITVDAEGNIIEEEARNLGASENLKFDYQGTGTTKRHEIAKRIDLAFASKAENKNSENGKFSAKELGEFFDFTNLKIVEAYYSLAEINYIVLFIGSGLVIWALYNAAFGLIMRIYKTVILFVISPPIVAIMPLDGGNAFKQWRTNFIGAVLGAYGVIVTLNLFFIILPLVAKINLFDPSSNPSGGLLGPVTNYYYLNNFVYLLFVIVGCFMFKDLSGLISKIIGGEDAFAAGSSVSGKATAIAASLTPVGGAFAAYNKFRQVQTGLKAATAQKKANEALDAGNEKEAEAYKKIAEKYSAKSAGYMSKFNSNAAIAKMKSAPGAVMGAMGLGEVNNQISALTGEIGGRIKGLRTGEPTKSQVEKDEFKEYSNKLKGKDYTRKHESFDDRLKALKERNAQEAGYKQGVVQFLEENPEILQQIQAKYDNINKNVDTTLEGYNKKNHKSDKDNIDVVDALEKVFKDAEVFERMADEITRLRTDINKMQEAKKAMSDAQNAGDYKALRRAEEEYLKYQKSFNNNLNAVQNKTKDMAEFAKSPNVKTDINIVNNVAADISKLDANISKAVESSVKASVGKIKAEYAEKKSQKELAKSIADAVGGDLKAIKAAIDKKGK